MKQIVHRNTWQWGKSNIIIIEDGAGVVTVSYEDSDPETAFISGLSVNKKYRRNGLGNTLLRLAEEDAKRKSNIKRLLLYADPSNFAFDW